MADGYDPADPAQTRHFMDVDDQGDDDEDDKVVRDGDREKDVTGHLAHQHRQHSLMNQHQFQGLHSYQPLQGLHSFHRAPPSQPPPPPPPLNLSLSVAGSGALTGVAERRSLPPPPPPLPPSVAPLPQLILASGRLVPGLQVTQLLVPTPQGVASQTVLAIPVSHVSPGQIVNLALADGQVICTTLGQLLQGPEGIAPSLRRRSSGAGAAPPQSPPPPPPSSSTHLSNGIASSINRLAANNCDLTITPTPPPLHPRPTSPNTHTAPSLPLPPRSSSPSSPSSPASASASPRGHGSPNSPDSDFLDDGQPTINQASTNMVDGINLDEIKEFAKAFKLRRLSLGLTQTQVGQALSVTEGPAYSQSAICSALATQMICAAQIANQRQSVFEKLDITPKSAQKIKPVLEHWMKEAEERYKIGQNHLTEFIGMEPSKKRKRRTSFTPQALELLNAHFERNTHPSGTEITGLAHQLGYDREVIRIWFCNKRQALKNTVRMMSKGLGVT